MFNTIGSFATVYFALAAILFLLVLFEKQLIALEDKIKARATERRKAKQSKRRKAVRRGVAALR